MFGDPASLAAGVLGLRLLHSYLKRGANAPGHAAIGECLFDFWSTVKLVLRFPAWGHRKQGNLTAR